MTELFKSSHIKRALEQAVPKHLSPDRFLRLGLLAMQKTPQLQKASPLTFLGALTTCATLGLEPNTPLGHAYLIPFEARRFNKDARRWETSHVDVQVIIGYTGFVQLYWQSGLVTSLRMGIASHEEFESGDFDFEYGSNAFLRHRHPRVAASAAEFAFAYAFAGLKDGQAFTVMPQSEIHRIRNGSQGYQAAMNALAKWEKEGSRGNRPNAYLKAPWIAHEESMVKKTPMRDLRKIMPMSVEVAAAHAIDEPQDRRLLDWAQLGEDALTSGHAARERVLDGGVGEIDDSFADENSDGEGRVQAPPVPERDVAKTSAQTAAGPSAKPAEPAASIDDDQSLEAEAEAVTENRASAQNRTGGGTSPREVAPDTLQPVDADNERWTPAEAKEQIAKAANIDTMQWIQDMLGRSKVDWSEVETKGVATAFKERLAVLDGRARR